MRVKVYKNLRQNKWSVVGPDGKVIDHVDHIVLDDPEFRVQPAGNARVRAEGRKNVHAYVVGERANENGKPAPRENVHRFTYNPYKHDTFVWQERGSDAEKPLTRGDKALLLTDEAGDLTLVANPT